MSQAQRTYIAKADLQSMGMDDFLDMDLDAVQLLAPKKVLPRGKYAFVGGTVDVVEIGQDKNSGIALPFKLTGLIEMLNPEDTLPEDIEWPIDVVVNCQLENDKDGNGKRRLRTLTEGYAVPNGLKTGAERIARFEGMTGVLELNVETYTRSDKSVATYNSINPFTVIYN